LTADGGPVTLQAARGSNTEERMKREQHRQAPCAESYALEKILKEVSDIISLLENSFVLYTDGITGAKNPSGEIFHQERLPDVLRGHRGRPEALTERILTAVQTFAGPQPQSDDLTLVTIKHT